MSALTVLRSALRRLFGRWTRKRGLTVPSVLGDASLRTLRELDAAALALGVTPDVLKAARETIKRHYETSHAVSKRHTVPDPALNVDQPLERVDRLPCFGGPLDGELLTDVEFYADGSFVGAVRTDADVRGGCYAWCRLSHRAVWTQDR